MKNKIIFLFLIISFFMSPSFSQDEFFSFETKNIEITDNGNINLSKDAPRKWY